MEAPPYIYEFSLSYAALYRFEGDFQGKNKNRRVWMNCLGGFYYNQHQYDVIWDLVASKTLVWLSFWRRSHLSVLKGLQLTMDRPLTKRQNA